MLDQIITEAVMGNWRSQQNPTAGLRDRIEIMSARDALPEDHPSAFRLRWLRARRSAWDTYVNAASALGLVDDDLTARLTGCDDDGFRGAIAECLACWYLAGPLRLQVNGRGQGRPGRLPDFSVNAGDVEFTAEVKAPYVEPPQNRVGSGDASDLIATTIDVANKQFSDEHQNLLILVPSLPIALRDNRYQGVKAFYGEYKIVIPVDPSGKRNFEARSEFFPQGKFLKRWPEPRFTRIGAILSIEETFIEPAAGEPFIGHRTLVMHNPHASRKFAREMFGDDPQFVEVEGGMSWSDGAKIM